MNKVVILQKMINECQSIVFFGGAGVSTDSGIKDFRSKDGLYKEHGKDNPEYMLSAKCFYDEPETFYEFYRQKLNCLEAEPNVIHKYLQKLEESGKLVGIVTQNIDGLHEKAGNKKVYLLHGTIYRNYCLQCGRAWKAEDVFKSCGIARCNCGGVIKPDVVLYGEMLPEDVYLGAMKVISSTEMLIVAGTSLKVEPASSMIKLFKGKYLVIINNDETDYDKMADLVIHENLSHIFAKLKI